MKLVYLLPRPWLPSGQSAGAVALKMGLTPFGTMVEGIHASAKTKPINRYRYLALNCPRNWPFSLSFLDP